VFLVIFLMLRIVMLFLGLGLATAWFSPWEEWGGGPGQNSWTKNIERDVQKKGSGFLRSQNY
jgi:hypothetical protein